MISTSLRAVGPNFIPLRTISTSLRAVGPNFIPLRTISTNLRAASPIFSSLSKQKAVDSPFIKGERLLFIKYYS